MSTVLTALTTRPTSVRDAGLIVGRVALGVVLIAHGRQKLDAGLGATGEGFDGMGVPLPTVSAGFVTALELVGGALLIIGALTTLVGLLVAATMTAAAVIVHADAFYVTDGGWELVGVLAALGLLLAATGPGRFSVDALVAARVGGAGQNPGASVG